MTTEEIFQNTFVISLPHRFDRRHSVNLQLEKHNIKYNFFDAVNGHEIEYNGPLLKGEEGVRRSHVALFEQAIENKLNGVLILEDDVEFSDDLLQNVERALSVSVGFDMLYLGASHHQTPVHVGENLYKISHSYTAHALYVSSGMFNNLIQVIKSNPTFPVDVIYALVQPSVKAYAIFPHLAWQTQNYSDIQNKFVDYDFLKKEFVRFQPSN